MYEVEVLVNQIFNCADNAVYYFDNFEEAAKFAKLTIDNGYFVSIGEKAEKE